MEGFLEEGTTELDLERLFQAWAAPPAEHKGIKKRYNVCMKLIMAG